MSIYNNKICTEYKKLPLCNPDFIYLDGPGQFSVKKDIKGISTRHKDMMPMASDILKLEYFLMPGSMIVCDGRAANVKFIKDHFKRKWKLEATVSLDNFVLFNNEGKIKRYTNEIEILKEQQRELEQNMKDQTKTQLQMLQERRQYVENEKKLAEATQSGLSKLFNTILEGVADFLAQLGTGLIAAAVATEAFKQYLLTKPTLALAAGAAAIVASAGVRAIIAKGPKFADGGIVSGPTLGLVGEYPGASTNPEVIAPLDKLKSLIGDTGNGGNGFIAETRISGRDLAIVLNRYNQDLKRG
jgi:hypothetical protein